MIYLTDKFIECLFSLLFRCLSIDSDLLDFDFLLFFSSPTENTLAKCINECLGLVETLGISSTSGSKI